MSGDTYRSYPPIGGEGLDEAGDEEIIDLVVRKRWQASDAFYRPFIRQIEDNLRMVAGRHWDVWIETEGRFVDVSRWMSDDEKRWRQRPVFNWTGYWYMITHSKLTENQPIVTFLPASPDRLDSMLAEIMDPIHKYNWRTTGMTGHVDMLGRWIVGAGCGCIKSFWDPDAGERKPAMGPALYELLDPAGNPVFDEMGEVAELSTDEEVPYGYGEDGEPVPMIQPLPGGGYEVTGEPAMLAPGNIARRVINPMSVRTSRHLVPFHEKPWYVERMVLHVDEIRERWGVEVEPEAGVGGDEALDQLAFGLGDVGASQQKFQGNYTDQQRREGFAVVFEMWEKPRDEALEGRHTVVTRSKKILDEANPIHPDFRPYEMIDFITLPHRPVGKTPVEDIAPINRTYNRGWGQILEHRNLMTNPKWIKDSLSGIKKITNKPGEIITALRRPGVPALEAVQPPQLPSVVYQIQQMLKNEMQDIGSLRSGSEGNAPHMEASGELVKELRYNDDRYIGPAGRNFVGGIGRMAEQDMHLLRYGWDEERMIEVAGTDNTARFLTVRPEMFKGNVNIQPVVESMAPESRGERQKRLDFWLGAGLIEPRSYFEMFNHPHLGRAARPGGVHASMAESEHAQMLRGAQPMPIEAHNDDVHLEYHNTFMAAPEFLELDPAIQANFMMHVRLHEQQQFNKMVKEAGRMGVLSELVPGPNEGQEGGGSPPA